MVKYRIEIKQERKTIVDTPIGKRTFRHYPEVVSFNIETSKSITQLKQIIWEEIKNANKILSKGEM